MSSPFEPHEIDGLVLASRSPRRSDILAMLGFEFRVEAAPEDAEDGVETENVYDLPILLAQRKCDAVATKHPDATVIGADTLVIVGGAALPKPRNKEEARRFLEMLSGRTHDVVTGVAVKRAARDFAQAASERTTVTFRDLTADEIDNYISTGEGNDKAGGYGVQRIGAGLVQKIDGCFYNVVGLPVAVTLDLLRASA